MSTYAFQYLRFFLEDDEELERIRGEYESGKMESGELKARCTQELQAYVGAFRDRRKQITEAVRDEFMRPRQLVFRGMPGEKEGQSMLEKEIMALEREVERERKLREDSERREREALEKMKSLGKGD